MRLFPFFSVLAVLFLFAHVAAFAAKTSAPAVLGSGSTQLAVDEEAGTVRVLINGHEIAIVDETGLHVNGDLTYTGTIKDTGRAVKPE